ncbi:hypothetical protein BK133_11875 [Paenibacillus sp. FSL H8-0548]|uniref:PspA/IM30 family protein n=1 Tax=Paenibacillus sp. FSL H8-0548 TaxID=1920422 RepID=UPI00096D9EFF|nr:PspA/IM30 family protein [Paenibacillus sp. FSL H8-0548]OMF34702.1 hypothetical protein BK133_11875 [Paenibacillus sp. FSL H8-0548]
MGILQRVVSMTKAAANEMLDKIENPVTMLKHYLKELDEEIASTERESVQQLTQQRILQAKLAELKDHSDYYERNAVQAASEGRESDARIALEAKLLYMDQTEDTLKLLRLSEQASVDLGATIETLKEEKTKLQGKRNELVARVQQTSAASGNSSSAWQGSTASRGFDRIEQKIMEKEAELELNKGIHGSSHLESAQLNELHHASVEEELKQLLQKKSVS